MDPEHSPYIPLNQYKGVFYQLHYSLFSLKGKVLHCSYKNLTHFLYLICTMQTQDLGKYLTNYETIGTTASILLNLKVIPNRRETEQ